jgi:hypothetical protein
MIGAEATGSECARHFGARPGLPYALPVKARRRYAPTESGDPSQPAGATITVTHRYGRVLSGYPLAGVCVARNLLVVLLPFADWLLAPGSVTDDQLGPPQYLILRDKASGRRIARLALGRDDVTAHGRQVQVEDDFESLGREQFLNKYLKATNRP